MRDEGGGVAPGLAARAVASPASPASPVAPASSGAVGAAAAIPRRELVLAAVVVVAVSRLADGPATWAVALLLAGAVLAGALNILTPRDPAPDGPAVALASLVTPAVAAFACLGAIRLVPIGPALIPGLLAAGLLLNRTIRTETRLALPGRDPSDADRAAVLAEALIVAFLAFLGTAALVPGGLPEPGGAPAAPMTEGNLLLFASVDAAVAGLLGYRIASLRGAAPRAAAWSAATYASAIAIAAAALRATDIPRLVGPALLTLVLFLWDAFHGAPPARRRDPRWIGQVLLLVALGAVVVAWNLGLR